MELILLAVGLLILCLAGIGLYLLISPRAGHLEILGYSFPLGCALISLSYFVLALRLRGGFLLASVSIFSVVIFIAGVRRRWAQGEVAKMEIYDRRWAALVAMQVAFVSWSAYRRQLGWDGLLIFELKARLAFLNGGAVPVEYYHDALRLWSHPIYPLLLPLTESWLYHWMGTPDQQLVKILFPLFLVSCLALFYLAARRAGYSVLWAPLFMLTMPYLWFGYGTLTSGYSDFPLAVFYLGAILCLLDFRNSGNAFSLAVAGAMLAAGCFLKQEGTVLWVFASLSGGGLILFDQGRAISLRMARWALLAFPGLVVISIWKLHLRRIAALAEPTFLPVTPTTVTTNLMRLPTLGYGVFSELTRWKYWGPFWLLVALALAWAVIRRKQGILVAAVGGPFLAYCSIYLFSAWSDWLDHFTSSFSRLLLHLMPVSLLLVIEWIHAMQKREVGKIGEKATN